VSRLEDDLGNRITALSRDGLFDEAWYVSEYPDVVLSGLAPLEHYVRYGARLGRPPRRAQGATRGSDASQARAAAAFDAAMDDIAARAADPEFTLYLAGARSALRDLPARRSGTLVSVIMPTRDRAYVIGDAIASIRAQTHARWELLVCDDGSSDATGDLVASIGDDRVRYLPLAKRGAAAARNHGLRAAHGEIIAYLDSDNVWHPRYLECILAEFDRAAGICCTRANYAEVEIDGDRARVTRYRIPPYSYDALCDHNFIDLNTFAHRRSLFELFGGFNEGLNRLQDWDLALKYLFSRDPATVDLLLGLYRRNPAWGQISRAHADDQQVEKAVAGTVKSYYAGHAGPLEGIELPSATVLSWDVSRNHFSKAFNICEAVAPQRRIALSGFRFFEDPIFPPYADARPGFPMRIYPGGSFPAWLPEMERALAELEGDVLYAVKPRLPSLGLALLSNHRTGKPFVLEVNDVESVVAVPRRGEQPEPIDPERVDPGDPALLDPGDQLWSRILEALAPEIPIRVTHNYPLDNYLGGGAFFIRNPKDERYFDPSLYDRRAIRAQLGISNESEQVILFSGLLREHKGVLALAEMMKSTEAAGRWLVVVGSRHSSELEVIRDMAHPRVIVLDPVDRNEIARITAAADAVVLWLDPEFAASRYQMPFKLTDALAMKVPVLANPIGDLEQLGNEGYLRLVPFADSVRLAEALRSLQQDPESVNAMVEAGRRLYLRQFGYSAVRANFALAVAAAARKRGIQPAAERFAAFFDRFLAARGYRR
jgi:glycosyltransferase involved in cell wall biosynthesis